MVRDLSNLIPGNWAPQGDGAGIACAGGSPLIVGNRIVAFAGTLFGWLPGGLAVVTTVSCLLFGGVSGSARAGQPAQNR